MVRGGSPLRGKYAPTAALFLLVACAGASPSWQRAGVSPIQVQNDLERCWADANAAVPSDPVPFQQQPAFGLVPPVNTGPSTSGIAVPYPGPPGADVTVLQRRNFLVEQCMRRQGYTARS